MRQNRIRELQDKLAQLTANEDKWRNKLNELNDEIWRDKSMARTLSTDEKLKNLKAQFDKKREEVGKAQKALAEAESKVKNLQSDMMNLQAKYMNTLMYDDGIDVFDLPPDELKTALKMASETTPDKSESAKEKDTNAQGSNTEKPAGENSPAPEHSSDDEDSGYLSEGTAFYV